MDYERQIRLVRKQKRKKYLDDIKENNNQSKITDGLVCGMLDNDPDDIIDNIDMKFIRSINIAYFDGTTNVSPPK